MSTLVSLNFFLKMWTFHICLIEAILKMPFSTLTYMGTYTPHRDITDIMLNVSLA